MTHGKAVRRIEAVRYIVSICVAAFLVWPLCAAAQPPRPLVKEGSAVNWWFVFKLNATAAPGCGGSAQRTCIFGGTPQAYTRYSQQFIYATDQAPALKQESGCLGDSVSDPVGATYDEVYNGDYFYVVWNDQLYKDPQIQGCGTACGAGWGHSKGMMAWDESGAGFIMQVTTPNWPGAGSAAHPRHANGNTLGCLEQPKSGEMRPQNNVEYSQDFFALRLSKNDVIAVLKALANASVATDPGDLQLVKNGGPQEIQDLVDQLGGTSHSMTVTKTELSSGVTVISKPAALHVPPWQMVSAELGGASLRVASWWGGDKIYTTTPSSAITCWDPSLGPTDKLGTVEIAKTGEWDHAAIGLVAEENHGKIGVSLPPAPDYAIFGDMNQDGTVSKAGSHGCNVAQNRRGGLFFVVKNKPLTESIRILLKGETARMSAPDH